MKGFYQPAGKLTACSLLSGQLCQKECPPGRAGHRFCRHGLDPAAFFHLRAFDQRVQAQPGLLLSGLDFFAVLQMQEEMQLTVLFGHYHVWRLFTYPVMVLLPFLLIMTINAQLDQALNERKSELYAAAKQD